MDLEERQVTAVRLLFALAVYVPIVIGAGSGFATGWAYVLGVHDVHGTIWGWLSARHVDGHGHVTYGGSAVIWEYFLGVATAYIIYQVCELLHGCFTLFREALA